MTFHGSGRLEALKKKKEGLFGIYLVLPSFFPSVITSVIPSFSLPFHPSSSDKFVSLFSRTLRVKKLKLSENIVIWGKGP